jgi:MFS family permease
MSQLSASFPALASREFRIFWVGQAISLIGTWMQTTVQPYLAYRLTSQPIYLGLVGFAATLPLLLFTLPAGIYVERHDKRRIVIVMQVVLMAQSLILAALTLAGVVNIWHIIILAFVLGTANSIEITARQAMLSELVSRDALANAIALNSTIFNSARVLGPTIAAPFLLLLGNQGEGWAFFANGISYGFVIISLLMISRSPHPPAQQLAPKNALTQFGEGQRYILQSPVVAMLVVMASILGFFAIPIGQQIPVLASEVLQVAGEPETASAIRNSLLLTAQGTGALISAVFLAVASTRIRRKGLLLLAGQIPFGIAFVCLGLTRSLPLALILIGIYGWGTVTHLATTNTLIQLITPDHLRGRVISTYLWGLQGVAPFGNLLIGWIVQENGLPMAILISGGVCLASTVLIHTFTPALRRIEA